MTDKQPFWVQVEKTPNFDDTGYMHFDLADVQFVGVDRATNREKNNEPLTVHVKTVWGEVKLVREQAQNFLDRWNAYNPIPEDRKDKELIPSGGGIQGIRQGGHSPIILS